MKYGKLPHIVTVLPVKCEEFMFYQYLPIKTMGDAEIRKSHMEERLDPFQPLIGAACCDYVALRGLSDFVECYVYVTAKHMYQAVGCPFNRPGWHSDGFGTDDINYIWYNNNATVFNCCDFNLSSDDQTSLEEMNQQALPIGNVIYQNEVLLRLDQYSIHRVAEIKEATIRTFLKISISRDRYDLAGNSRNYRLNYNWPVRPRKESRNVPQSL